MRALSCIACGTSIKNRDRLATKCFPCLHAWGKNSGARDAYKAVSKEIKAGRLADPKTLTCADCGKAARDYDHRDYNKPLEVEPVCRSCNKLRGPAIHVVAPATQGA